MINCTIPAPCDHHEKNEFQLNGEEDILNTMDSSVRIFQPILYNDYTETNETCLYSLYINWTTLEGIRTGLRSIQCLFIYDNTDSTECRTNFVNITFVEGNNQLRIIIL